MLDILRTKLRLLNLLDKEITRQNNNVELIASENFVSDDILDALGSCFTNKYSEGYPANRISGNKGRYYGGCENVDEVEQLCCDIWLELFRAKENYHVNVQPHSGSQANMAAYFSVLNPGDTILAMTLDNGGHLTHGSKVNFSGKLYNMVFYNVDNNGLIDYDDLSDKIKWYHPNLVLAGASAYSRIIDFEKIKNFDKNIIFDGLYAASIGYFDKLLDNHGIKYDSLHMFHDVNFGGGMPEPKPKYLKELIEKVKLTPNSVGFANDGDSDRFGVINENGEYVSPNEIIAILDHLMAIVYPGFFRDKTHKIYNIEHSVSTMIEDVMFHLNKQICVVLKYTKEFGDNEEEKLEQFAQKATVSFMRRIPKVREYLETDLQAAYDGDPAARSKDEIVFSYPGLYAITVYRLAHELFLLGVPLIPRMMTEQAHSKTGIDIHPGATIGKYFFIDHGTGIVIGETTIIGCHVKLYQGVTLGALSTKGGQKLRDVRRHPTIGDNVTIYSGASILGGETVIEEGVVIGGNSFITQSIKKGTKVSVRNQELIYHSGDESLHHKEQDESWFYII